MSERDKFLTEAMGMVGGWHHHEYVQKWGVIDFSTWQGFGKLWEWAQEQEWWGGFGDSVYEDTYEADPKYKMPICELEYFINPCQFANAIYIWLKPELIVDNVDQ